MLAENYKGYKGLPELVGLLSMKEAITKGLTVSESVSRLKRFHWMAKRLSLIFTARITSMPVYELKMAFGLHAHYLVEHTEHFFNRVREMREPPYGMDAAPHPALDVFLDELQSSPDEEFITGMYEVAIPAFLEALEKYLADSNKLFEHPTYRVCRFAALEIEDINNYGKEALKIIDQKNTEWIKLLHECLLVMGD